MPVRIASVQEAANRLAEALHDLQLGLDRHDTMLQHVLALLRYGKSGQPGVGLALDTLYRAFVDVVRQDGSRGESEAEAEFTRMVADAEHPLAESDSAADAEAEEAVRVETAFWAQRPILAHIQRFAAVRRASHEGTWRNGSPRYSRTEQSKLRAPWSMCRISTTSPLMDSSCASPRADWPVPMNWASSATTAVFSVGSRRGSRAVIECGVARVLRCRLWISAEVGVDEVNLPLPESRLAGLGYQWRRPRPGHGRRRGARAEQARSRARGL